MAKKKKYISASELVGKAKKNYDEDLLKLETMQFFSADRFLFPAEEKKTTDLSRESREAMRAYKRGLLSVR